MAKINEKQVENLMKKLEITREEALETIAFDMEEVDNEEAAAIEQKIVSRKNTEKAVKKESKIARVKTMKAAKKEDAEKTALIELMKSLIKDSDLTFNDKEMSDNKVTFQGKSGAIYSMAITKHRKSVDGYKEIALED